MIRPAPHIRYHIAAILAAHWIPFVAPYKRWIRPVVFENVRKVLACRTPVLGCHIYQCGSCGHVELIPHSCKSRFCPTCGKHATDVWANQLLNNLLDVAYHHLMMAIPWPLRIVILMNRKTGLNLITHAATESVVNVHFVDMLGASPDIAYYALRSFLISESDTDSYGNAMMAMMA